MEKVTGIEIPSLGLLKGRDCIFLDTVTQDQNDCLVFRGELNGMLAERIAKNIRIPYTLSFRGIIAYSACELDTYLNMNSYGQFTDFNVIENSKWLAELPVREDLDKSVYQHYLLITYDYVYNIIAASCEMDAALPQTDGERGKI